MPMAVKPFSMAFSSAERTSSVLSLNVMLNITQLALEWFADIGKLSVKQAMRVACASVDGGDPLAL